jgi:plastocyanin
MRSKTPLAVILVLAAFALVACGGDDDDDGDTAGAGGAATTTEAAPDPEGNAPAPSGEAVRSEKVRIVDFAYDPDPVTIQEGGKVIWHNEDSEPHTATAEDDSFDTGVLGEGKIKSESFKEAGTYPYICTLHPEMRGTIEVVPSG